MISKVVGTIFVAILLYGCKAKHENQTLTTTEAIDTSVAFEGEIDVDSAKGVVGKDNSDCIRGEASSVTIKEVYPHAVFKPDVANQTGSETVELKNGERLIIKNWGCEYFVLTFRIETERFQNDTTNTVYWLGKAAILMDEIQRGIDAPLNLQGGIDAIAVHLASLDSESYIFGKEIVYNEDAIQEFVTLDRVQRINGKRFAIEVSFAKGPL
jgi:hypothetical protein